MLQGNITQYLSNQYKLSLLINTCKILDKIHSPSEINQF